MPDDPVIGQTHGDLGVVYADLAKKQLYCFAECPPVGRIRCDVRSLAFGIEIESSEKDDGTVVMDLKERFLKDKASEAVRMLESLSGQWQMLWPRIYPRLLQVRQDYHCTEEMTEENCSLVLYAPDEEGASWCCELQLEEWDGFYAVEFNLSGEMIDACASF